MSRAHPRVGGENAWGASATPTFSGSSPRGRGKRLLVVPAVALIGLIPAWAGKTGTWIRTCSCGTAHPRVGGENRLALGQGMGKGGSSPRGRGKRLGEVPEELLRRLIPAWAGKTKAAPRYVRHIAAHPRVGGENSRGRRGGQSPGGSSPRGRGKPRHRLARNRLARLIPAWAGKTKP